VILIFFVLSLKFEQKLVPNAKIGFSKAMSNGWLKIDKSSGSAVVVRQVWRTACRREEVFWS